MWIVGSVCAATVIVIAPDYDSAVFYIDNDHTYANFIRNRLAQQRRRRAGGRQKVLVIDNASIQADDLVSLCERLVNRHGRSVSFGYGGTGMFHVQKTCVYFEIWSQSLKRNTN